MARSQRLTALTAVGALATAITGIALPSAHAATTGADRHVIGVRPSWTAHAAVRGPVASGTAQSFHVVLQLRDAAGAEALATAVSDPSSPQYGKFVSAATWRARFAPTSAQVAQVTSWLKSQGLQVVSTPANHRYLQVTGATSAVNRAFTTTLSTFTVNGSTANAPSANLTVPQSLSGIVAGVTGLDTSRRAIPAHTTGADSSSALSSRASASVTSATLTPKTTLPGPPDAFVNAGPCSAYYGQKPASTLPKLVTNPMSYAVCGYKPGQLRSAYGVDTQLAQGIDGRGATVAIVDAFASPTIQQDATDYALRNDPRHPLRSYQFSQSLPASYNSIDECGGNGWYGEETLDVEAVHATAPAANILYAGAASCNDNDLNAAVNTVVDNQLATVVSNSYSNTGEPSSVGEVAEDRQTAIQAAAQGISLLFSSGDDGDEVAATGSRVVNYEASDPFVTAVGGTALALDANGKYLWEQGWGTGKSKLISGKWTPTPPAYAYGGGGGTSQLFAQPAYQKGVVPASISNYFGKGAYRAVPDVSMVGDPQTGFLVGERQTFPDGSVRYSEYRIGGTSLSAPLFAGVLAVATQAAGHPFGLVNARLYKLAGTSALHDVNHGRTVSDAVVRVDYLNGVDASGGTQITARTLNQTGSIYTRKGYDDVTGVGSPNGASFFYALASMP